MRKDKVFFHHPKSDEYKKSFCDLMKDPFKTSRLPEGPQDANLINKNYYWKREKWVIIKVFGISEYYSKEIMEKFLRNNIKNNDIFHGSVKTLKRKPIIWNSKKSLMSYWKNTFGTPIAKLIFHDMKNWNNKNNFSWSIMENWYDNRNNIVHGILPNPQTSSWEYVKIVNFMIELINTTTIHVLNKKDYTSKTKTFVCGINQTGNNSKL